MEQNRLWQLMARKLSGEATEDDLKELDALMRRSPASHHTYEVLRSVWKKNALPAGKLLDDPGEGEGREDTFPVEPGSAAESGLASTALPPWEEAAYKRTRKFRKIAGILTMACLAGIAGLAFYFYPHTASSPEHKPGSGENEIVTRFGSRSKILLPDGTRVWLNAGSKLTYPSDFSNLAVREVNLSGEAFFEVVHDRSHPFVIHTRYMEIKDLGTRFNVKAYSRDSTTEATLIAGSIEVSLRNDPSHKIILKPNEKITCYNRQETTARENSTKTELKELKHSPTASHAEDIYKISGVAPGPGDSLIMETAWVENKLVFRSEPFGELAEQMERWYNVKIRFKDEGVRHYIFTGVFADETINQALDELRMIAPFRYSIIKNEVIVTK